MKKLSLIVLILSFALATPAMADDDDGNYDAMGPISCGSWVERRSKADGWHMTVAYNWIFGYTTAYNLQTPDTVNILGNTDKESVYLWIDKYCHENPLKNLAHGMAILTDELWPNRKRTADK